MGGIDQLAHELHQGLMFRPIVSFGEKRPYVYLDDFAPDARFGSCNTTSLPPRPRHHGHRHLFRSNAGTKGCIAFSKLASVPGCWAFKGSPR